MKKFVAVGGLSVFKPCLSNKTVYLSPATVVSAYQLEHIIFTPFKKKKKIKQGAQTTAVLFHYFSCWMIGIRLGMGQLENVMYSALHALSSTSFNFRAGIGRR